MSARVTPQFTPVPLATLCLALRAVEAETGVYQGNLLATDRRDYRIVAARHRLWRLLGFQGYAARAIAEVCRAAERHVLRVLNGGSAGNRTAARMVDGRARLAALPAGTSAMAAAHALSVPITTVRRWRQQASVVRPSSAARMREGMFRAAPLRTGKTIAA